MTFKPSVEAVGEFKDTTALSEKADKLEDEASDVKAVTGQIPDGMELKGSVLHVDTARYEIVGKVKANFNNAGWANMGLWVYPYAEGERWRYGYCGWQVPLSWVTLTIWAWVVPLAYPCKVGAGSVEARQAAIVKALRRATKVAGGDTVLFAFGGLSLVNAQTGQVLQTAEATWGEGYAVRTKGGAPAAPTEPLKGQREVSLPRAYDLTATN
jgi:hypothetical protein